MTRRDFVLIAECLSEAQKYNLWNTNGEKEAANLMKATIASNFVNALGRTNPRFDRDRFLQAAGVHS